MINFIDFFRLFAATTALWKPDNDIRFIDSQNKWLQTNFFWVELKIGQLWTKSFLNASLTNDIELNFAFEGPFLIKVSVTIETWIEKLSFPMN